MTARLERPEQPDLGAGRGQRINNVSQSDATLDAIQGGEGWDFPFLTVSFVQFQDIIWLTTTEIACGVIDLFYIGLSSNMM